MGAGGMNDSQSQQSQQSQSQSQREGSVASSTSSRASSNAASGLVPSYKAAVVTEGTKIAGLPRRLFDSDAGLVFCTELIIQDEETVMTM